MRFRHGTADREKLRRDFDRGEKEKNFDRKFKDYRSNKTSLRTSGSKRASRDAREITLAGALWRGNLGMRKL